MISRFPCPPPRCNMPNFPLPYTDTKPQGAADFYFAINATFRFLYERLGRKAWIAYLEHLARGYFRPVNQAWQRGDLPSVASYWKAFFDAEPGGDVKVRASPDEVVIEVRECPAIAHLRRSGRAIVPYYCEHCAILGAARAAEAGFSMNLFGGNGSCRHVYRRAGELPPQNPADIKEVVPC